MTRKIYDCFCFFNELDVLEVRLEEHRDVCDYFVIAESPVTFQGDRKPLHFAEAQHRFKRFADRIRHVVVDDMPATVNPWEREHFQRNALRRGLFDAAPGDTVLVSDVDEICRPSAMIDAAARHEFCFLEQTVFMYFMNWKATMRPGWIWAKAYAAPYEAIRALADLSAPREVSPYDYVESIGSDRERGIVRNAGWHFSWMGGVEAMLKKLNAFSHTEPEVRKWIDVDSLARSVRERRFFYDGCELRYVAVDDDFPSLVKRETARFIEAGLISDVAGGPGD